MKFTHLFATVALTLFALAGINSAAFGQGQCPPDKVYTVQPGDVLVRATGSNMSAAESWTKLATNNPEQVKGKGRIEIRRTPNGPLESISFDQYLPIAGRYWTKYNWKPGDVYCDITGSGFTTGQQSGQGGAPPTDPGQQGGQNGNQPDPQPSWLAHNWPRLLLLLGLLATAAIWGRAQFLKRRRANAARRGPAMESSPVTDANAADVFAQHAANNWNAGRGGVPLPPERFQIDRSTLQRWIAVGPIMASYNGEPRQEVHLNHENVYTADVVLPNGQRDNRMMLQACGNDLTYGLMSYAPLVGFKLYHPEQVPLEVQVPVSQPEPLTRDGAAALIQSEIAAQIAPYLKPQFPRDHVIVDIAPGDTMTVHFAGGSRTYRDVRKNGVAMDTAGDSSAITSYSLTIGNATMTVDKDGVVTLNKAEQKQGTDGKKELWGRAKAATK